jgi:signal transduction histidine kinase
MKERAAKIGGRLDVESGPKGTVVSIEWSAR